MPAARAARTPFFATCAPGVEAILHAELRALRMARIERQVGGVYFEGTLQDAWRANLWLRTAVRVLMRVGRFPCEDEDALYRGTREVDWSRWLEPEGTLFVDAHASDSQLFHTRFLEQRVKDAVVDQFRDRTGVRPDVQRERPDVKIHVHLVRDRCTLLLDTSGDSLHKRGWRRDQGRAPLAETLAAALIALSEWDERSPLVDPFCGSGTIPIEAALIAGRVAPGLFRERFGFEGWKGHDARGWQAERERARAERIEPAQLARRVLRGSDVDPERIEGARKNAEAAGVLDRVQLEVADAIELTPRPGWNAWIVSNLPYGERVGQDADLDDLFWRFGTVLRERCAGFHVALLCAAASRTSKLGLTGADAIELLNGGIECRLLRKRIED